MEHKISMRGQTSENMDIDAQSIPGLKSDTTTSKQIRCGKIDLGCGSKKQKGFIGFDKYKFPGVNHVVDLTLPWPIKSGCVSEAFSSHFIEHLDAIERIHFVNELYRVLQPKAKCTLQMPHWSSCRAYGDPTHKWPPMAEMWFYYLSREWRADNAPHTDQKYWDLGFNCDFDVTWGYAVNGTFASRSQEAQQFALGHYREAIMDMQATLIRK